LPLIRASFLQHLTEFLIGLSDLYAMGFNPTWELGYVSTRSLQRRLTEQVGMSPSVCLIKERVRASQELLESSALRVDRVASRVGFGSADPLRKHFCPRVGATPTRYRELFNAPA
jgi:AraC family transcriptional activator FtrA